MPIAHFSKIQAWHIVLLLLFTSLTVSATTTEPQRLFPGALPLEKNAVKGRVLLDVLRQGGNVIYFRHVPFAPEAPDGGMSTPESCRTQRVLSPDGIADARLIHNAFNALGIPVDEVLSSPMCRAQESATVMFGHAVLDIAIAGDQGGFQKLTAMIVKPVTPYTNRIIVGHVTALQNLAGEPLLAMGEAVVIRTTEKGSVIVARLLPKDWRELQDTNKQ